MSKITVTTIAGATSGADANTVKIESGDTLQVESNATVGGTLGVTGATTTAGITSSAAHTVTTSTHANASVFKSTGNTQIMLQDTDASANDQFWGLQNSGGEFNILTCNDDRASGFVTPMTITQAGQVTKPLQPAFAASSSSDITVTTDAIIAFDQTTINVGNHYSTSTNRFTAPVAGTYLFLCTISMRNVSSTGTYLAIYFKKNTSGTSFRMRFRADNVGNEWDGTAGHAILTLAANDYVTLHGYNESGSFIMQGSESNFTGYLLQ